MNAASREAVQAIRAAWADGIVGDRRGPGRTLEEIATAADIENEAQALFALRRLEARGELDGCLWTDALGKKVRLWWRRVDVLPGPDAPWIQPRAADRDRVATRAGVRARRAANPDSPQQGELPL